MGTSSAKDAYRARSLRTLANYRRLPIIFGADITFPHTNYEGASFSVNTGPGTTAHRALDVEEACSPIFLLHGRNMSFLPIHCIFLSGLKDAVVKGAGSPAKFSAFRNAHGLRGRGLRLEVPPGI